MSLLAAEAAGTGSSIQEAHTTMGGDVTPIVAESDTDLPVIEMVEPVPGFPGHRRFALVRLDDDGVLCALQGLDDNEPLRFLVVSPAAFFPDYAPVIGDDVVETLDIREAGDVIVLVIVNPGTGLADATANLLAPVVVNTATRTAAQVVLTEDLPVRAPLIAS